MRQARFLLPMALLVLVLSLAAFLRFCNLRTNPGWYSDEGAFINVVENLSQGRWQYFALQGSPLLVGRPPLFFMVLAGAFKLFGVDILVLRGLTSSFAVLTIALLYLMVREMFDARLALLSAGILAVYPWAVVYSRIGFTYNQLAFLLVISIYAAWKYAGGRQVGWGVVASVAAGLALATDYLGVVAVGLVGAAFLVYARRRLVIGVLLTTLTLLIVLAPIAISDPGTLVKDIQFTLFRVSIPPLMQVVNVVLLYGELIRREVWVALGLVGLFLLPAQRARSMILFVVCATVLLLVRSLAPVGRNLHHLIPLFPLLAMGVASFLSRAVPRSLEIVRAGLDALCSRLMGVYSAGSTSVLWRGSRAVLTSGIVFVFVMSPFAWMIIMDVGDSLYGSSMIFASEEHDLSAESDVSAVIHYLSFRVTSRDVVLASPQVAWAAPSLKADFAQALAFEGKDARVLPDLPRQRYVFDCSLAGATYVVLDPLTRDWAPLLIPAIKDLISEVLEWPLVFTAGELKVYRNPAK
jgi:4-amino-4-deoxy-L-arabinose transferase-like glycosyltransferase